jgi:hypothetical protein
MPGSSYFSPDYATARERFRAAARGIGARLQAIPTGEVGPEGQELTIDVAALGDERPGRLVVVSSGLHGVEGFLGSAIQLAALEEGPGDPGLPGCGLLFLHALNPYGFAWLRRTDDANIDLNRNFLWDGQRYEGSPATYAHLDGLLNPRYPPQRFDPFRARALLAIGRHGMPALRQAVAGGQYEFPRGLFFGGRNQAKVFGSLESHFPRWVGDARRVAHIDFHSGLGQWGVYKLLLNDAMAPKVPRIGRVFGPDSVEVSSPEGISYRSRGDLLTWCQTRLFPDRDYDAICAEVGTYRSLDVIAALRAENQAHHWGAPDSPFTRDAKAALVETFAPADPRWRDAAVGRGVDILRRAVAAYLRPDSAGPLASPANPERRLG